MTKGFQIFLGLFIRQLRTFIVEASLQIFPIDMLFISGAQKR
jgi:hypothetical protein